MLGSFFKGGEGGSVVLDLEYVFMVGEYSLRVQSCSAFVSRTRVTILCALYE